jgi:hypothetical protein
LLEFLAVNFMSEAEVLTLGYLSQTSSKILWYKMIDNSPSPALKSKSEKEKSELFDSAHLICKGNIRDMKTLMSLLEEVPCIDTVLALKKDPAVNQLFGKAFEDLTNAEKTRLAILQRIIKSSDGFLSVSSFSGDERTAMESLLKENILSIFIVSTMVTDDISNTYSPPLSRSYPLVNISSNLMRIEIENMAALKFEEERKKMEEERKKMEAKFEEVYGEKLKITSH